MFLARSHFQRYLQVKYQDNYECFYQLSCFLQKFQKKTEQSFISNIPNRSANSMKEKTRIFSFIKIWPIQWQLSVILSKCYNSEPFGPGPVTSYYERRTIRKSGNPKLCLAESYMGSEMALIPFFFQMDRKWLLRMRKLKKEEGSSYISVFLGLSKHALHNF